MVRGRGFFSSRRLFLLPICMDNDGLSPFEDIDNYVTYDLNVDFYILMHVGEILKKSST